MTRHVDEIAYTHLSAAERIVLAQDILDSVLTEAQADPLTPDQLEELARRCADIDSGNVQCLPWEQVRAQFLSGK